MARHISIPFGRIDKKYLGILIVEDEWACIKYYNLDILIVHLMGENKIIAIDDRIPPPEKKNSIFDNLPTPGHTALKNLSLFDNEK